MSVILRNFQDKERIFFEKAGYNVAELENQRIIVEVIDEKENSAWVAVPKSEIEFYSEEYIKSHAILKFDKFLEEHTVNISKNDYWNDENRFPQKIIEVEFVENMHGEHTEIYRCKETGKYYMRQLCNEPFARWLSCCHKQGWYQDGLQIRANIIFKHGEETEKVTYNDWNGNAAYSNTFNPNFNKED